MIHHCAARCWWIGVVTVLCATVPAMAQDEPVQSGPPVGPGTGAENAPLMTEPEMNARLHEAVASGLAFLATEQNEDGSFGAQSRFGKNAGITALCALAFMSDGNTPTRGRYAEQVRKAQEFILRGSTETGLIIGGESHGPMYGHGFATLFLGELYGMTRGEDEVRVREALVKAVRLIISSQNGEGGWRYNPVPEDADVSVTICQIMALRSARNAGLKVPKETIDKAVEYVRLCQNPDGGFRYMSVPGHSAWPRSAAGVASLNYAGIYEDDAIERGLVYLHTAAPPGRAKQQAHYFYGVYYTAQAMYLAGGEHWATWWPEARDEILSRQEPAGSWADRDAGGAYATAMSMIVLQMPKRYLPIFQK